MGSASKYQSWHDVVVSFRPDIILILLLISLPISAIGGTSTLVAEKFFVESDPSGADVYLMGKRVGVTPITINERDIYPNTYPDEQASLYGKIILKKPGCSEYSKYVTVDDIGGGVKAKLDCGSTRYEKEPVTQRQNSARRPAELEMYAEKRLYQLKVLQELLDEGLITENEEKIIRKRILESR